MPRSLGLRLTVLTPRGETTVWEATTEVSDRLRRSLADRVRHELAPTIEWFFLELTTACNYACSCCPRPRMTRPQGSMPLEHAQDVLHKIAAYRKRHPLLENYAEIRHPIFLHVMGEPLLYPHLLELLRYGQRLGLDFALVTNASLLTREMTHELLDVGLHSIVMSLNAPDADSYAYTGGSTSFEQAVHNVQTFVAQRIRRNGVLPRIEIQLLSTRDVDLAACSLVESEEQVKQQLAFWSGFVRRLERHAGLMIDDREAGSWPQALQRPPWEPAHYLPLGRNIWLVVKRACNFANALLPTGSTVRPATSGRCPFGSPERTLCIFQDGSTSYCSLDYDNQVNLGNVFEESIKTIWTGKRMSRIRALMRCGKLAETLCRRCLGQVVPVASQNE